MAKPKPDAMDRANFIVGEMWNRNETKEGEEPKEPNLGLYNEELFDTAEEAIAAYTRRLGSVWGKRTLIIAKRLRVRTLIEDFDQAGVIRHDIPLAEDA